MNKESTSITQPTSASIIQNCWVVPDLKAAVRHWLAMGFGPFFVMPEVEIPTMRYRGQSAPLRISTALGHGGGVQIELVQQLSDGPSVFREALKRDVGGFHHVCRNFSSDYATEVAEFRENGTLAAEGNAAGMDFCYVDARDSLGCYLELVADGPIIRSLHDTVAKAGRNWDGSNPIRTFGGS